MSTIWEKDILNKKPVEKYAASSSVSSEVLNYTVVINMAMVAIGLKINIKNLLKKAPKVILCVAFTAIIQMMVALGATKVLF